MKNFKVFNKLVRDKISEMLANNGCKPKFKTLSDSVYVKALDQKLLEEANEVVMHRTEVIKLRKLQMFWK